MSTHLVNALLRSRHALGFAVYAPWLGHWHIVSARWPCPYSRARYRVLRCGVKCSCSNSSPRGAMLHPGHTVLGRRRRPDIPASTKWFTSASLSVGPMMGLRTGLFLVVADSPQTLPRQSFERQAYEQGAGNAVNGLGPITENSTPTLRHGRLIWTYDCESRISDCAADGHDVGW